MAAKCAENPPAVTAEPNQTNTAVEESCEKMPELVTDDFSLPFQEVADLTDPPPPLDPWRIRNVESHLEYLCLITLGKKETQQFACFVPILFKIQRYMF